MLAIEPGLVRTLFLPSLHAVKKPNQHNPRRSTKITVFQMFGWMCCRWETKCSVPLWRSGSLCNELSPGVFNVRQSLLLQPHHKRQSVGTSSGRRPWRTRQGRLSSSTWVWDKNTLQFLTCCWTKVWLRRLWNRNTSWLWRFCLYQTWW